jgi:hypothetical protein
MTWTDDERMRAQWTLAIARALGAMTVVATVQPPAALIQLFDDAMRVHVCESGPSERMVDEMEAAWRASEDVWEVAWQDTGEFRHGYERWSATLSHAHELLLRWLDPHPGRPEFGR